MKNRIRDGFIGQSWLFTALLFCLQPAASAHGLINQAQVTQLKPGQSVEREIAGGQTHVYEEKKDTLVRANGEILVHVIKLEHH